MLWANTVADFQNHFQQTWQEIDPCDRSDGKKSKFITFKDHMTVGIWDLGFG